MVELTEPSLPTEAALDAIGTDKCNANFEDYVGTAVEDSALLVSWLRPSAESWKAGDRTLTCVVSTVDGSPLTASVKGSGI